MWYTEYKYPERCYFLFCIRIRFKSLRSIYQLLCHLFSLHKIYILTYKLQFSNCGSSNLAPWMIPSICSRAASSILEASEGIPLPASVIPLPASKLGSTPLLPSILRHSEISKYIYRRIYRLHYIILYELKMQYTFKVLYSQLNH